MVKKLFGYGCVHRLLAKLCLKMLSQRPEFLELDGNQRKMSEPLQDLRNLRPRSEHSGVLCLNEKIENYCFM